MFSDSNFIVYSFLFIQPPPLPAPARSEHLHQKPGRQAVGEHRLQVLEGDAVVLALVLLLVPGLGEKGAHRCDGPRDQGTGTLRRKGLMGHTDESHLVELGARVPFLDQKSLAVVPRPTVFI